MGTRDDPSPPQLHEGLRRTAHEGYLRLAQEVHVGTGVDLPQRPVQMEGIGPEFEIEALRQHHLEDVALQDVLLGGAYRTLVALGRETGAGLRERVVAVGRSKQGFGPGMRSRPGEIVESRQCPVVGGIDEFDWRFRRQDHVVDQGCPLPPVVEGDDPADHVEDRIGESEVVERRVRQVLHLADHVVAEIADDSGVQRRQPGKRRRPEPVQDHVQRLQHPRLGGKRPQVVAGHLQPAAVGNDPGARTAPHEGEAAPAIAVLGGLQQEAGFVPDDAGKGRHRCDQVGQQLPPHGHYPVTRRERAEFLPARSGAHHGASRRRT